MGRDKAFLEVRGHPMVAAIVRVLETVVGPGVVVVGGDEPRIRDLGLLRIPDLHPGAGPLGGILTALAHFRELCDHVLVLSCDLPGASASSVRTLADAAGQAPGILVPVLEGRRQWMHACWPVAALPALEAAFATGERAPRRALGGLSVVEVVGLDPASLRDADRPGDLDESGRQDR